MRISAYVGLGILVLIAMAIWVILVLVPLMTLVSG